MNLMMLNIFTSLLHISYKEKKTLFKVILTADFLSGFLFSQAFFILSSRHFKFMMDLKKFTVINFNINSSVDVVPSNWINEEQTNCVFPKNKPRGFLKLQETVDGEPDVSWPHWEITVIKSYGNY